MNEPPLTDGDPLRGDPLTELTGRMRQLRHNSGLSYERMARNIYRSKTALAMADKGDRIPNWDVVSDYVKACGGDPAELAELEVVWRAAVNRRPAPRQRTATRPGRPSPDAAADAAGYVHLLDVLRASAGLTIRELSERVELPKSTLADRFNVKRLWPRDFTGRYLRACDLDDTAVEFWLAVYDRIDGARLPTSADPASDVAVPETPAAPVAEAVADGSREGVATATASAAAPPADARTAGSRAADPRVADPRVADPRVADPRDADPPVAGTDETAATAGFPVDATWVWFITALALAAVVIIALT